MDILIVRGNGGMGMRLMRCHDCDLSLCNLHGIIRVLISYLYSIAHWQVKLVHEDLISYRGTVYHYYNDTWGILCDEGWNLKSATVVCNQLGLGNAINYSTSVFHGSPVQTFLVTMTNCKGNEDFLKNCSNSFWTIDQTCSGQHVAGVVCEGIIVSLQYV